MNISKSTSNIPLYTRFVNSRNWLPGTISRPDDNTIKSTMFSHHEAGIPTILQLKIIL